MEVWSAGSFLLYGLTFFTEQGYQRAAKNFTDLIDDLDLTGKSYLVTGANTGIGFGACQYFAARGATVHMLCRNEGRGKKAKADIEEYAQSFQEEREKKLKTKIHLHLCDLSEMKDIRRFASDFITAGHSLDVLVNNAGVMLDSREVSSEGLCKHFTTNTLSNFLLINLLMPVLKKSADPRVIIVSSGGMLTEPLLIRESYDLQKKGWSGRTAYARTKRHQLSLTHKFAQNFTDVKFYAMHPGWTETTGVQESMPDFYQAMKGKLRTLEHGCDTIHWLSVSDQVPDAFNGKYVRDRQIEIEHFCISKTRYSTQAEDSLWNWCKECTGMGPTPDALNKLATQLKDDLTAKGHIKSHNIGLSGYPNTFRGNLAHASLKALMGAISDKEAQDMGQLLLENGYFHHVESPDTFFIDAEPKRLYQFFPVPTHQELLASVDDDWVQSLIKLADIECKSPDWALAKDFNDAAKSLAYTRIMPQNPKLKAVKFTTNTTATSDQLRSLLDTNMIERHKEWNKTFSYGRIIEYVNDEVSVQLWLYVLSGLDPREFVVIRRVVEFDDGSVAICEKSIEHGKAYPAVNKKSIRCDMAFQVRYWKPLKADDPSAGCFILQCNQTDIKGWIPLSMVNSSNIDISHDETMHIQDAATANSVEADDGEKILKREEKDNSTTTTTTTTTTTLTTTTTTTTTTSTKKD